MKISWISVFGVLLSILSIYVVIASGDHFAEGPFSFILFLVGLIYIIFGFRQRFQNSRIETSLVIFNIVGVANFLLYVFKIAFESPILAIILLIATFVGFCDFLVGIIYWILSEVKDFKEKKNDKNIITS